MNDYEHFIAAIRKHIGEPKVVIDVGALEGVGAVAIKAAFPQAEVYAVDPINLDINLCNSVGVIPVIGACWHTEDILTFARSRQRGLTSHYSRGIDEDGSFSVGAFRVGDIAREPDAIKIDAEGASLNVLCGMAHDPKIIQLETETTQIFAGQPLEAECFAWLDDNGYRKLWEDRCPIPGGEQTESIWLRK